MKNLTVAMKLGLGFGLVILLLITMMITAIINMASMNATTKEIVEDRYGKVAIVNQVAKKTLDNGRLIRNLLLINDETKLADTRQLIQDNRNKNKELLEQLDKMINTTKGREMYGDIIAQQNTLNAKYVVLYNLLDKHDKVTATEYLLKEFAPNNVAYVKSLDVMGDFQDDLMTKGSSDATTSYEQSRLLMMIIGVIAVLLGIIAAFVITRSLINQLGGEPNYAAELVTKIANGDMTVNVEIKKGDESSMLAAIRNMVEKLSQIINEVNAAASNIASASEEVSATAQNMSQASSEQAASVEETSASVEQMSASINQNAENAKITDGMASQASSEAVQGGEAVKETVSAMKSIAGKIGIIDDIAYQTNLLALNAAIEAARAGEHGKGFAVVASEVRKLAERSQVAAQEIGGLAESSVGRAESAGKLLDTIVPSIQKTSNLVQEIAAASEEQSTGVRQINVAVNQLNQVTQQNAASSEELAATSEEMSGQAAQLQDLMAFFKVSETGISSLRRTKAPVKRTSQIAATKSVHDESDFVRF